MNAEEHRAEVARLEGLKRKCVEEAQAGIEAAKREEAEDARENLLALVFGGPLLGLIVAVAVALATSLQFLSWWTLIFVAAGFVLALVGLAAGDTAEDRAKKEIRKSKIDRHLWEIDYATNFFDQAISRLECDDHNYLGGVANPRAIPQRVKIEVAARDGGCCVECGSDVDIQFDHVIPYSRGGMSDDPDNIQLLCGTCNRRKGNRSIG